MTLFFLNLKTTLFRVFEWFRVVLRYYPKLSFLMTDLCLALQYLKRNPHQISKEFLKKNGASNIYAYGETPLTTWDKIVHECGIVSKDTVFELGCGPGRPLFWLQAFVRCKSVGIDYLPAFIEKANRLKKWRRVENIEFRSENFLTSDLSRATVIYLYGTCLEEEVIVQLVQKFETLKKGIKFITVSYPLTDYSEKFKLIKQFEARFPWGKAYVFLNQLYN